jgi:hypothetical protein
LISVFLCCLSIFRGHGFFDPNQGIVISKCKMEYEEGFAFAFRDYPKIIGQISIALISLAKYIGVESFSQRDNLACIKIVIELVMLHDFRLTYIFGFLRNG